MQVFKNTILVWIPSIWFDMGRPKKLRTVSYWTSHIKVSLLLIYFIYYNWLFSPPAHLCVWTAFSNFTNCHHTQLPPECLQSVLPRQCVCVEGSAVCLSCWWRKIPLCVQTQSSDSERQLAILVAIPEEQSSVRWSQGTLTRAVKIA